MREEIGCVPLPVVMMTGQGNETIAVDSMKSGALDYLVKNDLTIERLRRAVQGAYQRAAIEREIIDGQKQLQQRTKELERQAQQLEERNQEILQLAFAMTHDMQTPLASLTGAVNALGQQIGDTSDEKSAQWMGRIEQASARMVTMLDNFLVYAKAGTVVLRRDRVSIADVLRRAIDEHIARAETDGVSIQVECNDQIIDADQNLILRVMSNLVGNAMKYLVDERDGLIRITVEPDGDIVRITITDNGQGIPAARLKEVFLPFKRATGRRWGTGLGLAIVKKYVEAFDGRVWLESDGESGATAVVEFPIADQGNVSHHHEVEAA